MYSTNVLVNTHNLEHLCMYTYVANRIILKSFIAINLSHISKELEVRISDSDQGEHCY